MSFNKFSNIYLFIFIFLISIQLTFTLLCYECKNCTDIKTCKCDNLINKDSNNAYCILTRENLVNGINVYIEHVPRNITSYVYDPYYIYVEELISYNEINQIWLSQSNQVTYACHTDKCNRDDLLKELPENGLSLMIQNDWLNENLQRKLDKNTTLCHSCPAEVLCSDIEYWIDIGKCNVKECQGSCLITDLYQQTETSQFCYQSFCSDDSSIGPDISLPKISINAIYYLNKKQFEIIEIGIFCNAEDCSDLEIFKNIKEKLTKNLDNIKAFLPKNNVNSIYSISFLTLIIIILFQI